MVLHFKNVHSHSGILYQYSSNNLLRQLMKYKKEKIVENKKNICLPIH